MAIRVRHVMRHSLSSLTFAYLTSLHPPTESITKWHTHSRSLSPRPHRSQLPKNANGPDLAVRLVCPECRDPNPNIVGEFVSGDVVCGSCGLILGDRVVDTRSEWRVSFEPWISIV